MECEGGSDNESTMSSGSSERRAASGERVIEIDAPWWGEDLRAVIIPPDPSVLPQSSFDAATEALVTQIEQFQRKHEQILGDEVEWRVTEVRLIERRGGYELEAWVQVSFDSEYEVMTVPLRTIAAAPKAKRMSLRQMRAAMDGDLTRVASMTPYTSGGHGGIM
eukprot:TRINITY_DN27403_c0_g1_i3.p2 TRINITY_DN27403_c0_g1~~TRINITY_DN27403_c0_g1_i3.p2  ORF type:complete len:164 (-),score=22.92 TRINITY_DN27403_c0_g1_i3:172-663(-)